MWVKMIHLTYWGQEKNGHYFADDFSKRISLKNAFIFHFFHYSNLTEIG